MVVLGLLVLVLYRELVSLRVDRADFREHGVQNDIDFQNSISGGDDPLHGFAPRIANQQGFQPGVGFGSGFGSGFGASVGVGLGVAAITGGGVVSGTPDVFCGVRVTVKSCSSESASIF